MSDIKNKFINIVSDAAETDDFVRDALSKMDNFAEIPDGDEFIQEIKLFSDILIDLYTSSNISMDQLLTDSKRLMEFINDTLQNTLPPEFDCKDPIKKGEITFDQVAGQNEVKRDLETNYIYPFLYPGLFKSKSKGILLYGPPGTGKCLHPEEKIIMFDGTIVEAQNVKVGDQLMGDDSTPRNVLSICSGEDEMFCIKPDYGKSFIVNSPHMLTLVKKGIFLEEKSKKAFHVFYWDDNGACINTFKNKWSADQFLLKYEPKLVDIPLNEYLKLDGFDKFCLSGVRSVINWEKKHVVDDPYDLGKKIGDIEYSRSAFQGGVDHIPDNYKINGRHVRKRFLAGLIDSHLFKKNARGVAATFPNKNLADDIVFLSRSIGFYSSCYTHTDKCPEPFVYQFGVIYHTIIIRGNLGILKTEDNLKSSDYDGTFEFCVKSLGQGKYNGFTLDGNGRFLLEDFTVTHNTMLAKAATASIPGIAFFAPTPGELRGKYEGETEKNIDNVFKCAGQIVGSQIPGSKLTYDSSIIFVDEFDSLAASRGDDPGMRRSVNAFLQAMDGITSMKNVSVIAATNYPWDIDEAILRRFSVRVFIDLPDEDARQWIIRHALINNYSIPGTPKNEMNNIVLDRDEYGNVTEWNDSIFDITDMYGSSYCTVEEKGGIFGTTKDTSTLITADYIPTITDKTGPTKQAKDIIDKIKSGNYVDPDEIDDENMSIKFGYSASDMDKMMDIAVQDGAYRALSGPFAKHRMNDETYYIAFPMGDKNAKYAALDDVANDNPKLKLLNERARKNVLNFSLCNNDIDIAIAKYPSTVKNSMYVKLLNFRYLGISP